MIKDFDKLDIEIEIRKEFNYENRTLISEVFGVIRPKEMIEVLTVDVLGAYRIYQKDIDDDPTPNSVRKFQLEPDTLYVIQLLAKNDFLSNSTIDDVNKSKTLKELILNVIDCGFVTFPKKLPFVVK